METQTQDILEPYKTVLQQVENRVGEIMGREEKINKIAGEMSPQLASYALEMGRLFTIQGVLVLLDKSREGVPIMHHTGIVYGPACGGKHQDSQSLLLTSHNLSLVVNREVVRSISIWPKLYARSLDESDFQATLEEMLKQTTKRILLDDTRAQDESFVLDKFNPIEFIDSQRRVAVDSLSKLAGSYTKVTIKLPKLQ